MTMYYTDNINVELKKSEYGDRVDAIRLKQFVNWLRIRKIKYSLVYKPVWNRNHPWAINMRTDDALVFKLVFGL
jgi:hypothetical protein